MHFFVAIIFGLIALCVFSKADADERLEAISAFDNGYYTKAKLLLLPLAERGDAAAQYRLGRLYGLGLETPQDYAAAYGWLEKAASQGLTEALFDLGQLYDAGLYVAQDRNKACDLFEISAVKGLATAAYNTGMCYELGQGRKLDPKAALRYYHEAARQNEPHSAYQLAMLYYDGTLVDRDITATVLFLHMAAVAGHYQAQNNLATLYLNGEGVKKSNVYAYIWYSLAIANRTEDENDYLHEVISRNLHDLSKQLTRKQKNIALAIIRKCMKNIRECKELM